MKHLKEMLRKKEVTVGSWLQLGQPAIAEIMMDAGFDWLVVDLEHSPITQREAEELIRIIDLKGGVPLVRVSSNDPTQIKRVMDAGAQGIIVPMVCTTEDAELAVRAVRYPPAGTRSFGLARAQHYGPGFEEYAAQNNDNAVVIVQIEHTDAIRNAEQILNVDGVDGSLIGPYDLSGSVGKPGQFDDPVVRQEVERYEMVSSHMGKPMGYHVTHPDYRLVNDKIKLGYSFIAFGTDFLFLGHSTRDQMRMLRESR